jgi:Tol biopolymer transport system component
VRRLIGMTATLVFVSIAAVAGATSEKVLNQPGVDEVDASASEGYLVWTADSETQPHCYNSYAMADGGASARINPAGTQSPSVSIDGDTIVYQEVHLHPQRRRPLVR